MAARWLERLFARDAHLEASQRQRIEAWRALPEVDLNAPPEALRFVVADVEATSLDLRTNRLIAIGAVTVENLRIDLARALYVVLRQHEVSSRENILLHGIGGTAQRDGLDPVEALLAFLEFCGKAPLVGFHAGFDDGVIRKATTDHLGELFRRPWIDLADLAPDALPAERPKRQALDDWLALFGIDVFTRHDAVADALATAQLFQAVLPRAQAAGFRTPHVMLWDPGTARWARR